MVCTLPKFLPLYKRYEHKFKDLCLAHDSAYTYKYCSKLYADIQLSKGIWNRGNRLLAICSFIACTLVGWWYWLK